LMAIHYSGTFPGWSSSSTQLILTHKVVDNHDAPHVWPSTNTQNQRQAMFWTSKIKFQNMEDSLKSINPIKRVK
jgi:hypothetical protein